MVFAKELKFHMSSITFDSHLFFTELKESGFDDHQAEAVIKTFKRAHEDANLATKDDIKDLRNEITRVRHEMREMRYQIIISLGGIIAVAVAVLAALIKLV